MLSEYHLLPSFFGRAMCQATKHLSQDFQENKSGLTIYPTGLGLASVKAAVSNPSLRDMAPCKIGDVLFAPIFIHDADIGYVQHISCIDYKLKTVLVTCCVLLTVLDVIVITVMTNLFNLFKFVPSLKQITRAYTLACRINFLGG